MMFETSCFHPDLHALWIDPKNPDMVYAAVLGALWGDSEDRGVYKTTDGGKTWTKLLYVNPSTGCADMTMDPENPSVIYASMWDFRRQAYSFRSGGPGSALYKSTDGGATWNKIHNGLPNETLGRISLAVSPGSRCGRSWSRTNPKNRPCTAHPTRDHPGKG